MRKRLLPGFAGALAALLLVAAGSFPEAAAGETMRERLRRARQTDRGPYVVSPATGRAPEAVAPPVETEPAGPDPREDLFRFLIRNEWCGPDVRYVFQPEGKALLIYDSPARGEQERKWNISKNADAVIFDDGSRIIIAKRERRSFLIHDAFENEVIRFIDCGPGVSPYRFSVKGLPPLPKRTLRR